MLQSNTKQALDSYKTLIGQPSMTNDEVLSAVVEPRQALEARGFKTRLALLVGSSEPGKTGEKARWMTKSRELAGNNFDAMLLEHNIERKANTIYRTAFENLEDAPFNATDRTLMLDAVNRAQKSLKREGYNLSIADIQAMLWYYEKRVYGELGSRQTADVNYEEAAQRVAAGYASGSGIESFLDDTGAAQEDVAADGGAVPVGEESFQEGATYFQRAGGRGGSAVVRATDLGVTQRYGTPRDGSISVIGVHYSRQQRDALSSGAYGSGLKRAESRRFAQSDDTRLTNLVHFYVD